MKHELTLATLHNLDFGKLDAAFKRHMKRAVDDCLDRPGDKSARTVRLEFSVSPGSAQSGECESVELEANVTSKVPAHRTRIFQCSPRKGGHLLFDDESPDDFNQGSFNDTKEKGDNESK